jgi:hypothetical protein
MAVKKKERGKQHTLYFPDWVISILRQKAKESGFTQSELVMDALRVAGLLGLAFFIGCAAIPEGDAVDRCLAHFEALDLRTLECSGAHLQVNAEEKCDLAYSVNDAEYDACMAWVKAVPCAEYQDAAYQAMCLPAFNLRTW